MTPRPRRQGRGVKAGAPRREASLLPPAGRIAPVGGSKLANALGPSFIDPNDGVAKCGTMGAPIEGCVPVNLFGGAGNDC